MKYLCEVCSTEFESARHAKYCPDCRHEAYRVINRKKKISRGECLDHGLLTKTCIICGKEFQTFKSRKITCSNECSKIRHNTTHPDKRDKEKRRIYDREKYLRKHPGALTAEERRKERRKVKIEREAQRKQAQAEREAEWAKIRAAKEKKKQQNIDYWLNYEAEHECVVCGKRYMAHYPTTKYCSNTCIRKAEKERTGTYKHRYKGITVDKDISLKKLAKRDHNQCQICGLFVNWNDFIKTDKTTICGDMYPSIDHITPISLGGLHSWCNVQLAHRGCNTKKNNKYIG